MMGFVVELGWRNANVEFIWIRSLSLGIVHYELSAVFFGVALTVCLRKLRREKKGYFRAFELVLRVNFVEERTVAFLE